MASKTINELTLDLNADMAQLKKDLAKAKGLLNSFQKGVKSIGASIKGAFAVGAIVAASRELFNFGKEAIAMGGELAGVKNAFSKLNQPGLLDELRNATKGTISDLNLMKSAVKADEFNIPTKKMGLMMRFAATQAQKMGQSVDYMVESITTGIARGSIPILDNLGLSAKELNAEMKKTGNISDAAFNVIIKKTKESGDLIETGALITARWGARWENMKASIGTLLNNALVKISPVLEDIRSWFIELWKSATQFIVDTYNGWVDLYNRSAAFRLMIEGISGTFTVVWGVVKAFFKGFWDSLKTAGKMLAYVFNPSNWGKDFGKGLNEIMLANFNNTSKLVNKLGSDIGQSFKDGVDNVINGKANYISIDDLMFKGGLIKDAKDLGGDIKQTLIKALKLDTKIDKSETEFFPVKEVEEQEATFWEVVAPIKGKVLNFANELNTMIVDSTTMLGENIGNALAGAGNGLESVIKGFMSILLDFGASLGKQLIATGTSMLALSSMMSNPFTSGPALIAAGIGIIAVTSAIKALMSKTKSKFAYGGIIPGLSYSGDRVPIMANSGEMVLNKGQQANLFRQINSGGSNTSNQGGTLMARISGNDLLFLLDQTRIRKGLIS